LKIAGTFCPQQGFEKKPKQMAEIVQMLIAAKPDIVFVALGSPKQEHLIAKLKPYLSSAWWLGVGVSFSFLTGHVKRAPLWMQRAGIEWLHRLGQEPRRIVPPLHRRRCAVRRDFVRPILGPRAAGTLGTIGAIHRK